MNPMSPQPDPRRPSPAGPNLAPTRPAPVPAPLPSAPPPNAVTGGDGRGWKLGLLAVAAAAVGVIGMQLLSGSAVESTHPNWGAVREASSRPPGEVRWQDAAGGLQFLPGILIDDADRDSTTTAAVQAALAAGDDAKAVQAVVAAQVPGPLPAAAPTPATPQPTPAPAQAPAPAPASVPELTPTLTPGMKAEVRRGDAGFVHLFLYDTCDEDGDVVDVLIDGEKFATVRLTNRGVTLSVPVSASGATRVQVRGVRDGGGGITVGCRTSKGQGFLRVFGVGDTESLAVIRK